MISKQLVASADVRDVRVRRDDENIGRDLAIPAIGKAPWGTHFCQFYDAKQDLLDVLVPYFRAGLEGDEMCVWVIADPLGLDEAAEALSREVGDLGQRVAQGQMVFMSHGDGYGDEGALDPERRLQRWAHRIRQALEQGYTGLRATGDVSLSARRHWESLMVYELALGQRFVNQRVVALCTFPLDLCDSSKMIDVLMRHRFALVKRGDWTLIEPSERKRATEAVELMNQALAARTAELQAALAELRGFGRWVTHDLRVPLRHIRSFGEWLAESCESKLDDEERRMFERVLGSADRMDVLITDIQAYSAAQHHQLHLRPLDLEALARKVWQTLTGTTTGGRHIDLRILPLPQAYGDRMMLTQVLTNLLGNAVKFTGRQPEAHVEIGVLTMNGEVTYYVRDNGVGFDPAHADTVFTPFVRLHSKADFGGSGLGLTTVKQIITRHGGRVWAEAAPGAGATFYFTLPEPGRAAPTPNHA